MKDAYYGDQPADTRIYPLAPGFKEETTSKLAASEVKNADKVREDVLRELRLKPSTADELSAVLEVDVLTMRPRVSELRKLNTIEPVEGVRRPSSRGKSSIVWRVKP